MVLIRKRAAGAPVRRSFATRRRRTAATHAAVAPAVLAAVLTAAPSTRANLTFANTFDTTSGGPLTQNQLSTLTGVESAYSHLIASNQTVNVTVYNLSPADYQSEVGGGVAYGYDNYGYYAFGDVLKAYQSAASTPLQLAAAKSMAAGTAPLTDGYTDLFLPGNTSNPAFATTVNYPYPNGSTPRQVRSGFVNLPLVEARTLGLTVSQDLFVTSGIESAEPTDDLDLYLLNDPSQVGTYSYGGLGSSVPAGTKSYARLLAREMGSAFGLGSSGANSLDGLQSQQAVVDDQSTDQNFSDTYHIEDFLFLGDLFRYRASANGTWARDLETGDAPTYFSADGTTPIVQLGTGQNFGDGLRTGYFDDLGDVYDDHSTVAGQTYAFSNADAAVLNTLGFSVNVAAVPEPATLSIAAVGAVGLLGRRRSARPW